MDCLELEKKACMGAAPSVFHGLPGKDFIYLVIIKEPELSKFLVYIWPLKLYD
jgi:hypothetical protein